MPKLPKMPKMPKIKVVNHFIKKKVLRFQDIAKLILQVSRLITSRKPVDKPTGWKVFNPHSLTPDTRNLPALRSPEGEGGKPSVSDNMLLEKMA